MFELGLTTMSSTLVKKACHMLMLPILMASKTAPFGGSTIVTYGRVFAMRIKWWPAGIIFPSVDPPQNEADRVIQSRITIIRGVTLVGNFSQL